MRMREIRFRQWTGNSMRYNPLTHQMCGTLNEALKCASFTSIGGRFIPLMQYTGLKDKNGKEIYEGDIVSVQISSGNKRWKEYCEIYYSTFSGRYLIKNPKRCEWEFPMPVEVEGNIYENTELLESEE